ncbi:hypothetical protein JCM8115_002267 [Rhodotorula mucilaginosa]|uniref:Transmembrane protein n=1 Tax=Rhodotorula mucilaginosa TaxID=5537 RepID=A0A9P6VTH0_RHOMI|nr:hypothetical protein C6P46_002358 [Rhodotorula mucilaginosa]
MFTSFSEGADHSGDWNDESAYLPGRFRAHPRPTSPAPSDPRTPNVRNLRLSALTLSSSSDAPPVAPKLENKRARALKRTLDALSPDRRRRRELEAEREGLVSPWLTRSGGGGAGEAQTLAAAERSPILGRHEFSGAYYSAHPATADEDEEDRGLLRPGRRKVEGWMSSWWRRWSLLVGTPCLIVWLWAAVPFPVTDPYKEEPPWHLPWPPTKALHASSTVTEDLPVDANFLFFLFFYYGVYLAIALVFVTKLFDLFRLNWWPRSLGGSISYISFWSLALIVGYLLHKFRLDGFRQTHRPGHTGSPAGDFDWQRKTTWVLLAFATMALPALACFAKLRADRRNSYRRDLTPAQKTFLERQLTQRMPRSYRRFLWFMGVIGLTLLALIIGQAFATVYLSTLPHSSFDGLVYVWTWIATVNVLWAISGWILVRKVRSQALICVFRFYYFLLYYVFYRTLFARLRSPDQAVYITLLSSVLVVAWYPISMSKTCWRILRRTVGVEPEWEEYAANRGTELYIRNLSENVTMIAFLGWVSILHLGPNTPIYPFFAFDDPNDPYTFRLTLSASAVIFAAELFAGYLARSACWLAYEIDVTNLGLDQFREHPELVIACIFTACHVLSDMLFFLVKLNFR